MAEKSSGNIKILAQNKSARHEFFIEDTFEAGMALAGTEVKSIRQGKVQLKESFILVKNGEAFIHGMHISPYEQGNRNNQDPLRIRKLLLHKREISRLSAGTAQEGMTIVPLKIYLSHGLVKLEIGLARGKKLHDKRHSLAERDAKRQVDRAMRQHQKAQ